MNRLRALGLMLSCSMFLSLLAGCAKPADKPATQETAANQQGPQPTAPAGLKTLKIAVANDLAKVDLHLTSNYDDRNPLMGVLEFLFGLDGSGAVVPILAKDYAWSTDGKTLTVNLRQGVKFHNGQEMTSKDVKYSLDRFRTKGARKGDLTNVKEVLANEKYVVEIQLGESSSTLLAALANPIAPVVIFPDGEAERQGGEITKPIGTGPYMFVEWRPDDHVTLKKFPEYSPDTRPSSGFAGAKKALVDEIIFRPIKDASVRANALAKGEVDIADKITYQDYTRLKGDANLDMQMIPSASMGVVVFGFKKGAFATDARMRQAVMYATNKQEAVDAITYGLGKVATAIIPDFSPFFGDLHKNGVPFDPEKAKQLLNEAGYSGQEVLISYTPGVWKEMAVVLQAQLQAIGMKAKLDTLEAGSALAKWQAGDFEIFVTGNTLRPDPSAYYQRHSKVTQSGYNSPNYDRLQEAGNKELDPDKRKQIYADLEKVNRDEVSDYPLIHIAFAQGARKNVTGFEPWNAEYLRYWTYGLK